MPVEVKNGKVFIGGCRWCNRRLWPEKGPLSETQTRACAQGKQTAVRGPKRLKYIIIPTIALTSHFTL